MVQKSGDLYKETCFLEKGGYWKIDNGYRKRKLENCAVFPFLVSITIFNFLSTNFYFDQLNQRNFLLLRISSLFFERSEKFIPQRSSVYVHKRINRGLHCCRIFHFPRIQSLNSKNQNLNFRSFHYFQKALN